MATRRGAKRSVIEISSSSEQKNGDEEYEGSSEESEPLSESDDDDFDSSASRYSFPINISIYQPIYASIPN